MKYFKCENCGSELTKNTDDTYSCGYCKRTYYDDSLEKAYKRVYENLRGTVQGIVSEELLKQKIEQIANCRQALYKECHKQFIDNNEIARWAAGILTLSPDDAQANFYAIASKKRWGELNQFMQKLNAREVSYLVEGFVDYLTNGQFVSECILSLIDLIDRAFDGGSAEYERCHKKIVQADERERSGIFDVSLPRDVFVAYSSKDKEQAYALVEYLEKNSFKCFIAMRNLAKGVDAALKYNERLKTAMDSCRVFLLVSSSNSRARDCDAYSIEMKYIRESDCRKSNDFSLANARYDEYLEKNRNRCKPRIEYLIEEYGTSPYEKMVKQFFSGLTWCRTLESVSDAVFDIIEGGELETFEDVSGKFATASTNNIDDLYKAFKERERQEELERKRQAEEAERRRKEEEERKRQEELDRKRQAEEAERKRKEEEERKRQEEAERKRQAQEAERKRKEEEERIKREFEIENGVLKQYKGDGGNVIIPDSVKIIGVSAFEARESLTDVTIPNSVTVIEEKAFYCCNSLTKVVIPDSVISIGDSAFSGSSLASVVIGASVNFIAENAFWACFNLVEVYNKSSLIIKVGHKDCGQVGYYAKAVYTSPYESKLSNDEKGFIRYTDGNSVALVRYTGNAKEVTIDGDITEISQGAFFCCESLDKVVIGNPVTSIGARAFSNCTNLTKVEVVKSIKSIGDYAFEYCEKLAQIEIPKSATLGKEVFDSNTKVIYWESEEEIKRKEELERQRQEEEINRNFQIENGVLKKYYGKGGEVVIPDGVTTIGEWAFSSCKSLTGVTIPKSVTSIEREAFVGCDLKSVIIPDSVTTMGYGVFRNCGNLTSVKIGNSVTAIPKSSFSGCSKLTDVVIGGSVTLIGESAFSCTRLQSLKIPRSVTTIEHAAFWGCKTLVSITIPESVTSIDYGVFVDCPLITIYAEAKHKPKGWDKDMYERERYGLFKSPIKFGSSI